MAVYPSNMAPIGVKLWENAFQTIPDISFFDPEKKMVKFFDEKFHRQNFRQKIDKMPVFEELWVFDMIGRCASKNDPQSFDVQLSMTFGRGVKEIVSIFFPTFGQK